jgi:hypothetical protein
MPLVDQASLQNRSLIVRMLELVEADCAYCILETVASVCGEDCVKESLHLATDYPIRPRACWPRLGDALATAQKEAMSRLLEAGMPFGLTTAAVRDQFVATGELVHGMAVYRSLHGQGHWLFKCGDDASGHEGTWAVSAVDDRDAWGRCEGVARIETRHETGDGDHFRVDSEMEPCAAMLSTAESREAMIISEVDGAGQEDASVETVRFVQGASALHVACTLLRMFGAQARPYQSAAMRSAVWVPADVGAIQLVGDIVVREGSSLALRAEEGASATLVLGKAQLRVERGAASSSFGSSWSTPSAAARHCTLKARPLSSTARSHAASRKRTCWRATSKQRCPWGTAMALRLQALLSEARGAR